MSFKLLGGGSDLNTVISDVNQNILELKGREVTEIFKDDTGTRRVLLGKGPLGYGLYVSPEGVDVYEADVTQLIFNSGQNVFKIVATDSHLLTIPAAGGGNAGTVEDEIDTGVVTDIPLAVMGFWDTSGYLAPSYWQLPFITTTYDAVAGYLGIALHVTVTSFVSGGTAWIRFNGTNAGSGLASDIRWYLLQETAGA